MQRAGCIQGSRLISSFTRNQTLRPLASSSENSLPAAACLLMLPGKNDMNRSDLRAQAFGENWVRFARKRCRLPPLSLCRLPKTYTWSATVLVDELDAGRRRFDGARARRMSVRKGAVAKKISIKQPHAQCSFWTFPKPDSAAGLISKSPGCCVLP